ncbi:hypothetical protein [Methyloceanibacter sp.]|uniref:hypothetical protein n=1 Tax=Methyloceanibacter sp. TaxID=1965321 RepID=UPI002CF015EE|nr:hypothetical protein [Methyloceanibacter sp.]HML92113.1 hypothetical protein [Methyloceanibacter sp.]
MPCAFRFLPAAVTAPAFLFLALIAGPSPVAAEPAELDNAGLIEMLENLGYEPNEGKYPSGRPFQTIKGTTPALTWTANLSANPTTHLIWIEMNFWSLQGDQKFPYDVLLEALERNFRLDTVRYVYLKDSRQLRLAGSLPNRDIKPVQIRALIDETVNEAQQTEHLWNPNKWRQQSAKEEPANKPEEKAPETPDVAAEESAGEAAE